MKGFKAVDNDLRDYYFEGAPNQLGYIPCKDSPGMGEAMKNPINRQMNADELEYLLYLKKKYVALSKELKQYIIEIRVGQAEQFIKRMDEVVSKTHEPKWEENDLSDYLTERSKPEIQDFIKTSNLLIQSDWYFELEDALFYGADLTCCKTNEEMKPWVDKILLRYREILEEALPEEALPEEAPEKSKNILLDLIKEDSPGTYKAIIKLIELNRVQITQDNKLNFISMKKGTVAHIFKEGGYTEWNRVMQFTLIDGKEDTGSLKTLAANVPPIEYEKIKKDIYQN